MKSFTVFAVFMSLSCNAFSQINKTFTSLAEARKNPDQVYKLDLSHQQLDSIPKEVFKFKNLKELDISGNNLSKIPQDIKTLKNLETLNLEENQLRNINKEILNLRNLNNVNISDNVAGESTVLENIFYLKSIGDEQALRELIAVPEKNYLKKVSEAREPKPWEHSTHSYGFLDSNKIIDAVNSSADTSLKNKRIKISLDILYVFDYPGNGRHHVLFDFKAKNQLMNDNDQIIHFSQTRTAQEGQFAGILSIPIFIGLTVGNEGVDFACTTINVSNESDEKFLDILESNEVKSGLKLVNSINPVVPIVSSLAEGIAKKVATRNNNKKIQEFVMGLDFSNINSRAKLREGTYIVVQSGLNSFDWTKWEYKNGVVLSKQDNTKTLPHNYLVFSISKTD